MGIVNSNATLPCATAVHTITSQIHWLHLSLLFIQALPGQENKEAFFVCFPKAGEHQGCPAEKQSIKCTDD